jgi:thioredoxin reductase
MEKNEFDVVVVGGGAAGLAAALQLGRARRSVVVADAGEPRNAPAAHMHGYLGHDGRPPQDFLAIARDEARRYGAEIVSGAVTRVTRRADTGGDDPRFVVELADGTTTNTGRVVLLATGLVDELPDIPGVAEQWGRGVLHCPYCHGWEVRDHRIVVIATSIMATHQALLFRQLSELVTVVVHEPGIVSEDDQTKLRARGVHLEAGPVAEVVADDTDAVAGVRMADGRTLDADAVVVGPRFVARTELLDGLGLVPVPAPMGRGERIDADIRGATSVPGVYAAGNAVDPSHQVLHAAADGSRVAQFINADLVERDITASRAAATA